MDAIIYALFSLVGIAGIWAGIIEFRLSRSLDAVIFPGTSLLISIFMIISSKFLDTGLFTPAEGTFLFAFWLCIFFIDIGLILVMSGQAFKVGGTYD